MRLPSLLVFWLVSCASCLASDQTAPVTQATSASATDRKQTPASTRSIFDPRADSGLILPTTSDGDVVCLKMRTYTVQRESSSSDVVRPARYTTCMQSKRIHVMRTAGP
jgi:hypothetical protein